MRLNKLERMGIFTSLTILFFAAVFAMSAGAAYAEISAKDINHGVYNDLCQVGIGIFAACDHGESGGAPPPADPCTIFDQMGNLPPNCKHDDGGGNGGGNDGGNSGGDNGGNTGGGNTGGDTGSGGGNAGASASASSGGGGGGAWGGLRDAQGYFIVQGSGGSSTTTAATSTGEVAGSATSTPSCDPYVTAFLKFGANNDKNQVTRLQHFLRTFEAASVEESGVFDQATLTAVNAFQMKYAGDVLAPWSITTPTGYVYLTTRKKINEIYCDRGITFPLTPQENRVIEKTKEVGKVVTPAQPAFPVEKKAEEKPNETTKVPVSPPTTPTNSVWDFVKRLFNRGR